MDHLQSLIEQYNVDEECMNLVSSILPHVPLVKIIVTLASFNNSTERCIEYLLTLSESELNDDQQLVTINHVNTTSTTIPTTTTRRVPITDENNDEEDDYDYDQFQRYQQLVLQQQQLQQEGRDVLISQQRYIEHLHKQLTENKKSMTSTTTATTTTVSQEVKQMEELISHYHSLFEKHATYYYNHNSSNSSNSSNINHNNQMCMLPGEIIFQIFQYMELDVIYYEMRSVCKYWRDLIEKESSEHMTLNSLSLTRDLYYLSPRFIHHYIASQCCHQVQQLDLYQWYHSIHDYQHEEEEENGMNHHPNPFDLNHDDDDDDDDDNDSSDDDEYEYDDDDQEQEKQQQHLSHGDNHMRERNVIEILKGSPNLKQLIIGELTSEIVKTLVEHNPQLENISLSSLKNRWNDIELLLSQLKRLNTIHFIHMNEQNHIMYKSLLSNRRDLVNVSVMVHDIAMTPFQFNEYFGHSKHTLQSFLLFDYLCAEAMIRIENLYQNNQNDDNDDNEEEEDDNESIYDLILPELQRSESEYITYRRNRNTIIEFPNVRVAFFGTYPIKGGIDTFHFANLKRLLLLTIASVNMKVLGTWLHKHKTIEEFVFATMSLKRSQFIHIVPAVRRMKKFSLFLANEFIDVDDMLDALFNTNHIDEMNPTFEFYLKVNREYMTLGSLKTMIEKCGRYLKGFEMVTDLHMYFSHHILSQELCYDNDLHFNRVFFNPSIQLSNIDYDEEDYEEDDNDTMNDLFLQPLFSHQQQNHEMIHRLELIHCSMTAIIGFLQNLPPLINHLHISFDPTTFDTCLSSISEYITTHIIHQPVTNYNDISSIHHHNNNNNGGNMLQQGNELLQIETLKVTVPTIEDEYLFYSLSVLCPLLTTFVLSSTTTMNHNNDNMIVKYSSIIDAITSFKNLKRLVLDLKRLFNNNNHPNAIGLFLELIALRTTIPTTTTTTTTTMAVNGYRFECLERVDIYCEDPFHSRISRETMARLRFISGPAVQFYIFDNHHHQHHQHQ